MTVIYADSLFLINTLVDYLVILMTGRLAGIPLHRKRFLTAALLGGAYAVVAVIPNLDILISAPVKVLVWILIALTAYGHSQQFLKLTLLLGIVSCALAGVVLALGTFLSTRIYQRLFHPHICLMLLLGGMCACLLCVPFFRFGIHARVSGITAPVELSIAGKTLTLTALLDTGNQLRDPLTGQPVLVVSACALQSVVSTEIKELLSSDHLQTPADLPEQIRAHAPELCSAWIPYQALGVPDGTLLTFRTDWIRIRNRTYPNAVVALAPDSLGFGYSALWGGTLKGDSRTHDFFGKTSAMAEESAEL